MGLQHAAHQVVRENICKLYTLTKFHNNLAGGKPLIVIFPRVSRQPTYNKQRGPLPVKGWRPNM